MVFWISGGSFESRKFRMRLTKSFAYPLLPFFDSFWRCSCSVSQIGFHLIKFSRNRLTTVRLPASTPLLMFGVSTRFLGSFGIRFNRMSGRLWPGSSLSSRFVERSADFAITSEDGGGMRSLRSRVSLWSHVSLPLLRSRGSGGPLEVHRSCLHRRNDEGWSRFELPTAENVQN